MTKNRYDKELIQQRIGLTKKTWQKIGLTKNQYDEELTRQRMDLTKN